MTAHRTDEGPQGGAARSWWSRANLVAAPLRRNLLKQRELILPQVLAVQGLMHLLMKPRNTGHTWTLDERRQIRRHLWTLVRFVPVFAVFLLPGGLLLLPVLAEVLDRRQAPRG